MVLPLIAIGAGAMAAGALGSYFSGALGKGKGPNKAAYGYDYNPDWTQANNGLAAQQDVQGQYGDLYGQAMAESRGETGPSVAQQQLAAGQSRAAADAAQAAASARGGPAASMLAARQAQEQANEGQLAVNRDAGILRAKERQDALGRALAATGGAASNAGAMRGGSIDQEKANMQGARWDQEGNISYDQAGMAQDENARKRNSQFWGKFMDVGGGAAVKGLAG